MESDTVETVTGWSSVPFSDGYAGLRDLAAREFTGAVSDGGAWLFMVNGRVVGVFDGGIERFEDADGTAYEAPHPSLPLLYAMQERGGETRAKYYSEETPLSEVDRTLKSGNFTGYVELSENVLSGDYYTVYHGGKAMSAAFVGNNRRLITGDEAFERADDEVGIYTVRTVDVDVVDIPGPESTSSVTAGAVGGTAENAGDDDETTAESDAVTGGDEAAPRKSGADAAGTAPQDSDESAESAGSTDPTEPLQGGVTFGEDPLGDPSTGPSAQSSARSPEESTEAAAEDELPEESPTDDVVSDDPVPDDVAADASAADESASATDADADADADATPTDDGATGDDPLSEPAETRQQQPSAEHDRQPEEEAIGEDASPPREAHQEAIARERHPDTPGGEESSTGRSMFDDESQWREARTIPALDPSETAAEPPERRARAAGRSSPERQRRQEPQAGQSEGPSGADSTVQDLHAERNRLAARVEELESQAGEVRAEADELRRERERIAGERDEAVARVESLEAEVRELEATVESLEARLADAEREATSEEPSGQTVPVDRAFEGTNLFVRYRRKSGPTLDDAFDGTASREEVNENVALEHHTDFDATDAVVDGRPFDAWLEGTVEYGFSRWIVEEFIHDVRETNNQSALEGLYGAIPDVDRIQFHGSVDVPLADGETESHTFDVVMRDRMGDPLVVADLNDSREPATEPMVNALVEHSMPVAEAGLSLAGAFFVTTSYFEPGALETAHEATGGGLLRRERRKSFVKLSRKDGYHLCLVETRNGEYHVNVPEL